MRAYSLQVVEEREYFNYQFINKTNLEIVVRRHWVQPFVTLVTFTTPAHSRRLWEYH